MPSPRRIEKMNVVLREIISGVLEREIEFPEGSIVTLTRADISPDGHYADILFSVIGAEQKDVLTIFEKNIYSIQHTLNRAMEIRPVPKIRFRFDEGEMRRETVEESIARLKREEDLRNEKE